MDILLRASELGIDITDTKVAQALGIMREDLEREYNAPNKMWLPSLSNDGEFEYTQTSDCDGTNVAYLRRVPAKLLPATKFEETTQELFYAAEYMLDF